MLEHTPGPWDTRGSRDDVYDSRGYFVATVSGLPEKEANRRLIAAAPDLLEACLKIANLNSWDLGKGVSPDLPPRGADAWGAVTDAIAKATGNWPQVPTEEEKARARAIGTTEVTTNRRKQ